MQDQIDAADAPSTLSEPATHIQIRILYRWVSPDSIRAQTEILFSGVRPTAYSGRVTCGLLLMALGCFELVRGVPSEPMDGYTDCIMVSTQSRQIFATAPVQANNVITEVITLHARELGISAEAMTEDMIARFIGEAVEILNGAPEKINARGGEA